ncbi:Dabb family protein [Wenyingzhuangia sp. IMCC45574]
MKDRIFHHNVYFWLNNPTDTSEREIFLACLKKFIDLSSYTDKVIVSEPARTPRSVVDSSYTFCLLVTFKSKEEHDLYQEEDVHLQFVKEAGHLWKKVQVFDSLEMWNTNVLQES